MDRPASPMEEAYGEMPERHGLLGASGLPFGRYLGFVAVAVALQIETDEN